MFYFNVSYIEYTFTIYILLRLKKTLLHTLCCLFLKSCKALTLFRWVPKHIQDGHFQGYSWMGQGQKGPPLHKWWNWSWWKISCNDETWHSYTLPKVDPKNIWIKWQNPGVLQTSAFFHRKLVNFSMSRNTDIDWCWYIISNFTDLLSVFKDCFNKNGCNFENVGKNVYFRPS